MRECETAYSTHPVNEGAMMSESESEIDHGRASIADVHAQEWDLRDLRTSATVLSVHVICKFVRCFSALAKVELRDEAEPVLLFFVHPERHNRPESEHDRTDGIRSIDHT